MISIMITGSRSMCVTLNIKSVQQEGFPRGATKKSTVCAKAESPRDLERTNVLQQLLGVCIVLKVVPDWLQDGIQSSCQSRLQVAGTQCPIRKRLF